MSTTNQWTKDELYTYILLLCANVDNKQSIEETSFIKNKVDEATFDKIYKEFKQDSEDKSLKKIADKMHEYEFSNSELAKLKKEIIELFARDRKISVLENNLARILDNILY